MTYCIPDTGLRDRDNLREKEDQNQEIAAAFHKFMVHRLGEQLIHTNKSFQVLMD